MRLFRIAVRQGTAVPVLALLFASGVSMALVLARILWTGDIRYCYLGWNLFLAWVPLVFALLAVDDHQQDVLPRWRFFGFAAAWLLFFPNAPYIFTDIIHLKKVFGGHFWTDLTLILSCAFTGLVVGFVSLYLMQSLVKTVAGHLASWLFIGCVAALSGFGVYVGRFLRFNTWDVLLRPLDLGRDLMKWAADPFKHPTAVVFPVLFSVFLFISYLALYALTHLPRPESVAVGRAQS